MLLGNHSYHHDQWRWLDPGTRSSAERRTRFARQLGVCPRFYRPPHGQRTPFVEPGRARAGHDHRDVERLGRRLGHGRSCAGRQPGAARRARPGSIILLHDGLDGRITADRSVVVAALPCILDGLKAAGSSRCVSTTCSADPATSTTAERSDPPHLRRRRHAASGRGGWRRGRSRRPSSACGTGRPGR